MLLYRPGTWYPVKLVLHVISLCFTSSLFVCRSFVLCFLSHVLSHVPSLKQKSRFDSSQGCRPNARARTYPLSPNQSTFRGRDTQNVTHRARRRLVLLTVSQATHTRRHHERPYVYIPSRSHHRRSCIVTIYLYLSYSHQSTGQ